MSLYRPENDETLEALARRLRGLPPPPTPLGLEERLLAAIPSRRRARRARSWLAATMLLAPAACLLFVVRLPRGAEAPAVRNAAARPAPTLWTYKQALRRPNADASAVVDQVSPPFVWPVVGSGTGFLSERDAGFLN